MSTQVTSGEITIVDINDGVSLVASRQSISLNAKADGSIADPSYPLNLISGAWINAPATTYTYAAKLGPVVNGQVYTASTFAYVEDDVGLTAGSTTTDLTIVANNTAMSPASHTITALGGGWYRVSCSFTQGAASYTVGVYRYATGSTRRVWIGGVMINNGATLLPYQAVGESYIGDPALRTNLLTDTEFARNSASFLPGGFSLGLQFAPAPVVLEDSLTKFSVLQGGVDTTSGWSMTMTPGPGVTGKLHQSFFAASAVTVDQTYIDVTATRSGSATLTTRLAITKTKEGQRGASLVLTGSAAGFTFTDGVALPAAQTIRLTAVRQNTDQSVLWYASNGVTLTPSSGFSMIAGLPSSEGEVFCDIDLSHLGTADQMYITAVCGDATAVYEISRINYSTAVAGATRNVFRGAWTSGTVYALGDTVTTADGSWSALVQHVASGGNAPPTLPTTSNAFWTQAAVKGDRGTIQAAVATTGSVWVDGEANAAIVSAGGFAPQRGDVVTLYNSSTAFSQTRVRTTGGAWAALAAFFGGDVLVDGTIIGTKLAATSIITQSAQINDLMVTNAHIVQLDASKANIGKLNARNLEVTEMLVIDAVTGSLSLGKNSSFDIDSDGIFLGRTEDSPGVTGFGFLAGKEINGIPQYLQITSQTGFKSVNARHYVSGVAAPVLTDITTSQTITLPVGSKLLDVQVMGGGGGGAGATNNSSQTVINASNGTTTTVQLWDGTTNTGISWSSTGGLGATAIHPPDGGYAGASSSLGLGGEGGGWLGWGTGAGGSGTGYGAGGGGGGGTEKGGNGGGAAVVTSVIDYDISALANPKLVIVVGTGGAGSAGQSGAGAGGAGSPGIVKYAPRSTLLVPANVLPLQPTFTGSIVKAASSVITFPAYGAGLWVLNVATAVNLDLGIIETHTAGNRVRLGTGSSAVFISDKTPVDLFTSAAAYTVEYQFFKLSEWV